MAGLVIIDEKGGVFKSGGQGYPHSTVVLHYDSPKKTRWFGFFPVGELYGKKGGVIEEERENWIDNYIRFQVAEAKLDAIANSVVSSYRTKTYNLGVCDCVSFAADACRAAGIGVPRVNITPGGFVWWLKNFKSDFTHYNAKPYPWKQTPPLPPGAKRSHVVKPGDTLSKISQTFYGRSDRWQQIYDANKQTIGPNPNVIKVGQTLVIP